MQSYKTSFLELALRHGALRFGSFTLKSGRISPYFFNLGLIATGAGLRAVAGAYADAIIESGLGVELLFGPAYKGIPLVAAVACALAERGRDLPFAYNRKEAKDHGEGGVLVGAAPAGRALIVDDVITAGTALNESHALLRAAGAVPVAAIIAVDRQEIGPNRRSAVAEASENLDISIISLVTVRELLEFLAVAGTDQGTIAAIESYQARYGVSA